MTLTERARTRTRALRRAGANEGGYRVGQVRAATESSDPPDGGQGGEAVQIEGTSVDVFVFGSIGGWFGVDAEDFVRDVGPLDVDRMTVHLNTPGGDATEGVAIANVLRAHRARVTVRVDGMAASAGSVIAMAGDEVVMGLGSQLMIHDAWTVAIGDSVEMARAVAALDSISNGIASTYAAKAGGTAAEWREVMRAESWYTADEAVAAGLADRVAAPDEVGTAEGEQVIPGSSSAGFWGLWDELRDPDRHDLSGFAYAGRAAAPAPPMPGRSSVAASAAGQSQRERSAPVAFTDEQLDALRTSLGLGEDASEQDIVDAAAAANDDESNDENEGSGDGGSGTEDAPGGAETVTVDAAMFRSLHAQAQLGQAAHERQQREDREALVSAAIRDGRIAPAGRDGWLNALARDPGTSARDALAGLQAGLIPVDGERGHAGAGERPLTAASVRESDDYQAWRF